MVIIFLLHSEESLFSEISSLYLRCFSMLNKKTDIMFTNKNKSIFNLLGILTIISAMLLSLPAGAQQLPGVQSPQPAEYSDDELVIFINAAQKIMPLQQESQMKMIEKIEEEDLTVDKFNNILESFSTGEDSDATEAELESFNTAMEGIQDIQMEFEGTITDAITEEGMTPAKYEEIMTVYQQDQGLQMRINILMEEMQDDE